ncbi:MAG: histidine kinase, dimerization and phosphoacceptor region [Pseudomonas sp.]|nr:histidine kinase, dimerization and phosphoacceptor region [Pseudomonas sp.]
MHASIKSFKFWPLSKSTARRLTAVLCLGSVVGNLLVYVTAIHLPLSLLVLNLATIASIWYVQRRSGDSINFQPRELAERMLEVQETERHRLSRELHDDIGQMLTAAKMQSDWLQRRLPPELDKPFAALCDTLDETLAKVRDVSAILNPRQLASLGLEASLRAHLVRTLANTPVHWSMECHQRLAGIPEEMAVAAFRITQEAVTNMLRHAKANNLLVRLQRSPEGLLLYIADDGLGFSPAQNPGDEGQRGMAGMNERIALLGGTLTVHSQPGKGTQIEALFPWASRARERANISKGL